MNRARHLVLGTAGHIDHGKSALVHALTGIDPDRLEEEKRRGITIELGFADLELDGQRVLSFVDVPGHERFVRHMVAGATGVDAVLLVVAADQGVQPQTREHLAICSLLGVRRGVVALTKRDLVDDELLEVAALELRQLLSGTFLDGAPIVGVSARSRAGLEELRQALAALFDALPERSPAGVPRLPVDRSFVMRGFGTVVTGTLVTGQLAVGDEVEVLPAGLRARIRGIQVHRRAEPVVEAGRRAAINLQGVDHGDVARGSTVTRPGALVTTRRLWARLALLPGAPESLRRGGPVRFHQGTADAPARLRVLGAFDAATLEAQIHLGQDLVLAPGDRFILRRPSPVDTVAGGSIVHVRPGRAREAKAEWFAPDAHEPGPALCLRLARAGTAGCDPAALAPELGRGVREVEQAAEQLLAAGVAARGGSRLFAARAWRDAAERAVAAIAEHHRARPVEPGISREALRASTCGDMPQESWRDLLAELERRGEIRLAGEAVARAEHRVVLGHAEQALADRILERFLQAGLEPPDLDEVVPPEARAIAGPVIDLLVARGDLVRVQHRRLFHAEPLAALRAKLRDYAQRSKTIDVAGFKELAGVTRKNAIPLLEHLDGERATRRVGDRREILL